MKECCERRDCLGLVWFPNCHECPVASGLGNLTNCIPASTKRGFPILSSLTHQGSIGFYTVNIHHNMGMYFLVWSTGMILHDMVNRDHIIQYTPCSLGSVFENITLGTVVIDTLPWANIRHTSFHGKQCSINDANIHNVDICWLSINKGFSRYWMKH